MCYNEAGQAHLCCVSMKNMSLNCQGSACSPRNPDFLADAGALCSWTLQEAAEQALEYALRHCHRAALQNKSRILYFLVPVKMLLGQLPAQAALQKYQLEEYAEIVDVSLLLQLCWSIVLKEGNWGMLHFHSDKRLWQLSCCACSFRQCGQEACRS